jgi:hypothetical protein
LLIRAEEDKIYNNNLKVRDLSNEIYTIQNGVMKTYTDQNTEYNLIISNQQKELELSNANLVVAGKTATEWEKAKLSKEAMIDAIDGDISKIKELEKAWLAAAAAIPPTSSTGISPASSVPSTGGSTETTGVVASYIGAATDALRGIIPGYSTGGMIKRFATGGQVGMDSVPALLTPGEFVVRKAAVKKYGGAFLNSMNMGALNMPKYDTGIANTPNIKAGNTTANINAPVYNTYSVNVNVPNTNADPDMIANKVMTKIRNIDNVNIRRINGY